MIAFLRGNFVNKTPTMVHVDVNGVGYELHISLHTYSQIQGMAAGTLYTHLHIREDAHLLYGFFEVSEKEMFLLLTSVSGVGTSTARMMLSSLKPSDISKAIAAGNTRQLESIKGIGKKSAERLVLELKDKLGKLSTESNISPLINNTLEQDALNALVALGIAKNTGELAISRVLKAEPELDQIEQIIKKALKTI
ncbi:MAG: Holliday junction branch migration protein RuvA [Chitinophagaceae bacterium]|nr:MAG: Holliday junction branch migration protein RuvA [Chitinophagaceae bacterium]